MIKKNATELNFVKPRDSIPTIEIDIDSLPKEFFGYSEIVAQALQKLAISSLDVRATIYVYQGMSVNFHENTFSAFFGVASQKKEEILDLLLYALSNISGLKVRGSDYIDASTGLREFHVENGSVWRPLDAATWYSETQDGNEDEFVGEDLVDNLEHDDEENKRSSYPLRYRAARSDTKVGVIRSKIEEVFGLPKGSVALCDPSGAHLRSDARISTLRKRWDF